MNNKELDAKVAAWEKRMEKKQAKEEKDEAERAEQLRQAYLRRTGRKEMKP